MTEVRLVRRGFTLVELLVVVAIISLLLGILLPALGEARRVATLSACLSNARQIALAVAVYANEFDGVVPHGPAVGQDRVKFQEPNPMPFPGAPFHATSQVWAAAANPPADPTGMAMGLLMHGDFNPRAYFCPGDDQLNHITELPKIADRQDKAAFSSYLYRQRTETQSDRLAALGDNSDDVAATALVMDYNTHLPAWGASGTRSNHEGQMVNAAYVDGSAHSLDSADRELWLRDEDYSEDSSLVARRGELFRMADEAYLRGGTFEPID